MDQSDRNKKAFSYFKELRAQAKAIKMDLAELEKFIDEARVWKADVIQGGKEPKT